MNGNRSSGAFRGSRTVRTVISLGAVLSCGLAFSGCRGLFDEDADSWVSKGFLRGDWRIFSIRLVDGLTLEPGENRFAGMPDVVWTLQGTAGFTDNRANIQYSVTVTGTTDSSQTTTQVFVGRFEVERNTLWVTQDTSGEVVRLGIRRNDAAIMVGQNVLENFSLFDGDGHESLWVRR